MFDFAVDWLVDQFATSLPEREPELLPTSGQHWHGASDATAPDEDAEWFDDPDSADEEYIEPPPSPPGVLEVTVYRSVFNG